MFRLIDNNQVSVDSWQGFRCTVSEYSQQNAFGEPNTAHRATQVLSGAFVAFLDHVFSSTNVLSREIIFNISIGNVINVDNMALIIDDALTGARIATISGIQPNTEGFKNYEISGIPNSIGPGIAVGMYANAPYDLSTPRSFDFFGEFVLIDSLNSVYITPDFDYENTSEKIQDTHYVRSGEKYIYKWGEFRRFNMGVSFVESGFKSIVNSYWNNNTELLFVASGDMRINSVRLSNTSLPIGGLIEPYTNLFRGTIELETY